MLNAAKMDSVAEDEKTDQVVSDMGNETSKLDVSKESSAISLPGQFHRVLVEPENSVLQPTTTPPSTDVKPTDAPIDDISEKAVEEEPPSNSAGDTAYTGENQTITNYSDEELREASRAIVERSIAEAVKVVGSEEKTTVDLDNETGAPVEEDVIKAHEDVTEITNGIISPPGEVEVTSPKVTENILVGETDNTDAKKDDITTDIDDIKKDEQVNLESKASQKKDKKSKKSKAKEQYLREREIIDSVKEFMKEEDKKSKEKKDGKKGLAGISLPSMFKFSKRKQKSDAEVTLAVDDNNKADIANTQATENNDNVASRNGSSDKSEPAPDAQGAVGEQRGVRRLNSLDSGIVMDKYCDNMNGVEYSVVNKTKKNNGQTIGNGSNGVTPVAAETQGDTKKDVDPVYMNGDKIDEDFVYINERAIDIAKSEGAPSKENDNGEANDKEDMDKDSGEAEAATKIKKVDQIRKTEKFKIKKKSWSFNIGGSKKTSPDSVVDGVVSMDPSVSGKESAGQKKSRWRLGKFSFRKADDLSASTPDLNKESSMTKSKSSLDSEVSESPEHVSDNKKKGTKLKKIKAKKEKKKLRDSQLSVDGDMAIRSSSMVNIPVGGNQPRSRRSIVEDEINYTLDAFEGVAVSDLSQDEDDVQVSLDPSGSKSTTVKNVTKSPTKTEESKEMTADNANDDSSGGVYVNITKQALVSKAAEATQEDKSPTKYIYAGDDEYAQIVKTANVEDGTSVDATNEELKREANEDSNKSEVIETAEETVEQTEKDVDNDIEEEVVKQTEKYSEKDTADEADEQTEQYIEKDTADGNVKQTQTPADAVKADSAGEAQLPVEETITDEAVSGLECKAAPDSVYETSHSDGDTVNETEDKDTESGQETNTAAYSNDIYSNEIFEAELIKQIQQKENEKEKDIEKETVDKSEKLKEAITEVAKKDRPVALDIKSVDNDKSQTLERGVNEVSEKDEKDEPVTPVSPTVISKASIQLSVKPRVTIMKEVGVQAPDIHMPLDREFDFGFIKGKPDVVSIGVQVSDSPTIKGDNSKESTSVTPAAYF